MATHACYLCYAASRRLRPCLLLLPGGALLADRDELSIAESALVGFLRSISGLQLSPCNSAICTVEHSLYNLLDPEWFSLYIL